jgi:hypothetical protein
MTAITGYGVWFWAEGIDVLDSCDRRKPCGGLVISLFGPMNVWATSTRTINLIIATGAVGYYGIMSVTAIVAGVVYVARKLRGKEDYWKLIQHPDNDVALDKRE